VSGVKSDGREGEEGSNLKATANNPSKGKHQ